MTDNSTPKTSGKDDQTLVKKQDNDADDDNYRGYGRNYPPSWTMSEKMSKETAEYQKGMPFSNCGKCMYYQSGQCKVVRGFISPEMVCKYFSEKYTPTIAIIKRR